MHIPYKNSIYKFFHFTFFSSNNTSLSDKPLVQPILFRHSLILTTIIGLVAAEFPLHACIAALTLFWIDSRYWKKKTCILFILFFIIGMTVGIYSKPKNPSYTPLWLSSCLEYRKPIRITGTVKAIKSAPNHRLYIILEHVLPESLENTKNLDHSIITPLPCDLLLTWENHTLTMEKPLPGQKISITVMIRFLHGFRNKNVYNIAHSWHQKNIYFQAWLKDSTGEMVISGIPKPHTSIRENLYKQVFQPFLKSHLQESTQHTFIETQSIPFGHSFIPALLFGDRFFIPSELYSLNCYAGIAHSLALSGQHLTIVVTIAFIIIAILFRPLPQLFIPMPRYKVLPLVSTPFAFIYLWLGNAPLSLLRASFMMFLWTAYKIKNTAITFTDVVILTLCCILLLEPQSIYSIGLQLSFIAVIAISSISPILYKIVLKPQKAPTLNIDSSFLQKIFLRLKAILLKTLLITLTAQIATLPLTIYIFGYISPWFLLNVFWIPILNIFVLPLAFLGLLFFITSLPTIAQYCITFASFPCEVLALILMKLNKKGFIEPIWLPQPHWTEILGLYLVFLSILTLFGRTSIPTVTKRIFTASFIILMITPISRYLFYNDHMLKLRIMDVGQGQSIILEWGKNKRALIDGGGFYSKNFDTGKDILRPVLSANHPLKIEFLALTHPHRDHIKGFLFLAKTFQINRVYSSLLPMIDVPIGKHSHLAKELDTILKKRSIPRQILTCGDRIYLEDNLFLEILSPPKGIVPKGNTGIIFRLVAKNHGLALIPGDAEHKDLKNLLKTQQNLQADVLILPHHGSKTGFLPKFYQKVQPRVAVASTGNLNKHDFPAPIIHNILLKYDIPLRTTAQEGEIQFEWNLHTF